MSKTLFIIKFFLLLCSLIISNPINTEFQVHLALTGKPDEMSIMWITNPENQNEYYYVHYGFESNKYSVSVKARHFTYTVENNYRAVVHEAILKNLPPDTQIYYMIKGFKEDSQSFSFKSAPVKKRPFKFLAFGDMDIGFDAQETVRQLKTQKDYDFLIHLGDLPYAWQEEKWDQWGLLVQDVSATHPYMVSPGNHEERDDFASFKCRFSNRTGVNSGSFSNLYYSFDYSHVHFVSLSSEHDYSKDSKQYIWLEKDLQRVNRKETPFIIVYAHRPMYSSNKNHGSEMKFRNALEHLLYKYKVDLVLYGHVHAYERTCPVYNGECIGKWDESSKVFENPKAPIHVTIGTAGFHLNPDWETPKPSWSLFRITLHGFSIISVLDHQTIKLQFYGNLREEIIDEFILKKNLF